MHNKKIIYIFSLFAILLCLSCTQAYQTIGQPKEEPREGEQLIFLPLIMKNWPTLPSFGVAINHFSFIPQAEETGAYWLHYNGLLWSDVQPTNSSEYLWSNVADLEANLIAASDAGLEVILTIRSTPTWAQKYANVACGPMKQDNFDEFAAFMKHVVARYSRSPYNVKYYEIWNEPDSFLDRDNPDKPWGCWGKSSDPYYYGGKYYADMLKVVYPAIKQANPSAQVVLGGLLLDCDPRRPGVQGYCGNNTAALPPKFIEGILKYGGGNDLDYLNFHGYNYYSSGRTAIQSEKDKEEWEANGGQIEGKLDYLNRLQDLYGIDKPYLVTEAGILFDETPTIDFQEAKADYVVYLYTRNIARGITGTTWYVLDNSGWRNSGLLQDPDRAFNAYKIMIQSLSGFEYTRDLSLGDGIIGFEFKNSDSLWVLFSVDGTEKSISTPAGFSGAWDLYGHLINPTNGKIYFDRPIYIELN